MTDALGGMLLAAGAMIVGLIAACFLLVDVLAISPPGDVFADADVLLVCAGLSFLVTREPQDPLVRPVLVALSVVAIGGLAVDIVYGVGASAYVLGSLAVLLVGGAWAITVRGPIEPPTARAA